MRRLATREVDLVLEAPLALGAVAGQMEHSIPLALVASEDAQLGPGEEIAELGGVDVIGLRALDLHLDVGQDRVADLPVEAGDLEFDVLARADILGGAAVAPGDAVEQRRVDLVADAEGEDTVLVVLVRFADGVHELVRIGLPHGRVAVREEDDHRGALGALELLERGRHRLLDVRAADGLHLLRELDCVFHSVVSGGRELVGERAGAGGEGDDVEAVIAVEVVKAEGEGLAGLVDLLAGHAAGGIEDEDDVLGGYLVLAEPGLWRQEDHEEPVLAALPVGDQVTAELLVGGRVVEDEVAVRLELLALEADAGLLVALAVHIDVVGR